MLAVEQFPLRLEVLHVVAGWPHSHPVTQRVSRRTIETRPPADRHNPVAADPSGMAPAVPVDVLDPLSLVALLGAGVVSLFLLRASHSEDRPTDRLRRRFVLGVPWGTLVSVAGVLVVYVVLQGGGQSGGPVVVGFRSWGFGYPLGMLTAAFAHASESHVTGNLLGTVVFAPIAEYTWSHYPTERGSHSFGDWRTNPFVRIGLFVLGVVLVGLATSFFTPGALIGFSGVVFAFGGVAVVTRPLLAVVGLLAERVVRLTYSAVLDPVSFARASEQFVSPSWADIAIQGHALGLFLGSSPDSSWFVPATSGPATAGSGSRRSCSPPRNRCTPSTGT